MLKNIEKKNTKKWISLLSVFFVFFLVLIFFIKSLDKNEISSETQILVSENEVDKDELCSDCVRRKIDGIWVKPGEEDVYPIALMIDNQIDARPSFGLSKANVVYEAEAEGQITRYLAVYASNDDISQIGPVRSARPYYVDWAEEYNALYCHCGGSPQALAKLVKDKVNSLNEFYNSGYYWRTNERIAPHNILTSIAKLNGYLEKKGLTEATYVSWKFKEDEPVADEERNFSISIAYMPGYDVEWKYNVDVNDYSRYLSKSIHVDDDGSEIRAKNIIIQEVNSEVIDEALRLKIDTIGAGKASVCLDGHCQTGSWEKKDANSRTLFYYDSGEEVELNAGYIWVEVVNNYELVDIN